MKPYQVWRDDASRKLFVVISVDEEQGLVTIQWLVSDIRATYVETAFNFDTYVRDFSKLEKELM